MRTIWLRHSFEARGRAKGRPSSTFTLRETHAFGVPELDPSEAPVAFSVSRRIPGAAIARPGHGQAGAGRQTLTYRFHDGAYLRSMLDTDEATPLDAGTLAEAGAVDGRNAGAWHDDPGFWADARSPSTGTAMSALAEVDAADLATARSAMAANVASLRCIDGTLWAPCPPPVWSRDRNGRVGLLVPGLDVPRVRDLAVFADGGRVLDNRLVAGPLVPWHVGFDTAARILGAEPGPHPGEDVEFTGDDGLPDGGLDGFRAYMLASDVDVQMAHADWGRIDPSVRMALATVSARCRAAVSGDPSPEDAMDEAAALLAALPGLAGRKGLLGTWPAFDDLVGIASGWAAARAMERELAPGPAIRDGGGMASFSP